jgi:preprotein translocase SecE subunit
VARDRKRAKQRRDRRAASSRGAGSRTAAAPPESRPQEPDLTPDMPAALEHAAANVEEFDAAIVRGAAAERAAEEAEEAESAAGDNGDAAVAENALQAPDLPGGDGSASAAFGATPAEEEEERPAEERKREGNRVFAFLRASWAELQRVQWPDRRQVTQATAVVLGFVAIAGLYLGLADFLAKEFVEAIL